MKLFKFPAKIRDRIAAIICLVIVIGLIIFIVLGIFAFLKEASTAQASDHVPAIARSFSQYFSPQVLRAADKMMKERFNCQPEVTGDWTSLK